MLGHNAWANRRDEPTSCVHPSRVPLHDMKGAHIVTYQLHTAVHQANLNNLIVTAQSEPIDDPPAMNEIIRRFEPLTRRLANSFTATDRYLRDDLANAAR